MSINYETAITQSWLVIQLLYGMFLLRLVIILLVSYSEMCIDTLRYKSQNKTDLKAFMRL